MGTSVWVGRGEDKESKARHFRPGTRALREIRKFQETTELLIPDDGFSESGTGIIQKEHA